MPSVCHSIDFCLIILDRFSLLTPTTSKEDPASLATPTEPVPHQEEKYNYKKDHCHYGEGNSQASDLAALQGSHAPDKVSDLEKMK